MGFFYCKKVVYSSSSSRRDSRVMTVTNATVDTRYLARSDDHTGRTHHTDTLIQVSVQMSFSSHKRRHQLCAQTVCGTVEYSWKLLTTENV